MSDQAMALTYNRPGTRRPSRRPSWRPIAAYAPGDLEPRLLHHRRLDRGRVGPALRAVLQQCPRPAREEADPLSRADAYHGSTYLSASLSASRATATVWTAPPIWSSLCPSPNPFLRRRGMSVRGLRRPQVEELRETIGMGADWIAAFMPSRSRHRAGSSCRLTAICSAIREICREHDILYISDEVVTAFGRLGHVFASEAVFGIDPDMIIFAKGVTSGYFPLGGVIISGSPARASCASRTSRCRCSGTASPIEPSDRLRGGAGEPRPARGRAPRPCARARALLPGEAGALADLPLVGEVRGVGRWPASSAWPTGRAATSSARQGRGNRIDAHCQSSACWSGR